MPSDASVIQMAEQLTEALLAQCDQWRTYGWEWWPMVPDPPAGYEYACSEPRPPQRPVRPILAQGRVGDFWWEVRAEDPAETGLSWAGGGAPKPLPHRGTHLLAILQRSCPPASPRRLLVVVGLDGMPQDDRRKWRKLLRFIREPTDSEWSEERSPRVSWNKFFRNSEALRRYGPRQLYVGKHLSPQKRQEIMALLLIYAWQAGMSAREEVAPWMNEYIRVVLPHVLSDDVPYFLEELLKSFALPLDASGVRAHLRHMWQMQQRQGGVDLRLVRGVDAADDSEELDDVKSDAPARHLRRRDHQRAAAVAGAAASDDGPQTLSLSQAGACLSRTQRQLRYMIDQGKISAIRRGCYWRIPLAEVERLERQRQVETLRKALILLRARIQGGRPDSARRWLDRQLAEGQLPRQVFEGLTGDSWAQESPDLYMRIRQLLGALGPEAGWDA